MAQSGIEPATSQMVQHCLNQLRVHKFVLYFIYVCHDFAVPLYQISDGDNVCTVCGFVTTPLA